MVSAGWLASGALIASECILFSVWFAAFASVLSAANGDKQSFFKVALQTDLVVLHC
jgi:hypothetical protein